jgi:hypothetical protein
MGGSSISSAPEQHCTRSSALHLLIVVVNASTQLSYLEHNVNVQLATATVDSPAYCSQCQLTAQQYETQFEYAIGYSCCGFTCLL